MKPFLNFLLVAFIFTGCKNSNTKNVDKNIGTELITEVEKRNSLAAESIQKPKTVLCDFWDPDTSVSGIELRNIRKAKRQQNQNS